MKLVLLSILIIISVVPFAFADTEYIIETADNDLTKPGCLETEVGCYTPNIITVNVGHIVTMTNTDSTGIHTFTSGTVDGFAPSPDGKFDSSILNVGESFEWIPNTVGEYPYYCMLHTWMQGTILVVSEEVIEDVSSPEPTPVIIVTTDKASYSEGETIVISGNVFQVIGQTPIVIQILNEGSIVDIVQITVAQDGTFTKTFLAEGPLWEQGQYTVRASYQDQIAETTFNFISDGENESNTQLEPVSEPKNHCGVGTVFDEQTNSCILESDPHSIPIPEPTPEPTTQQEPKPIPAWVKGVFVFWVNGEISDAELTSAITFLVESGIIILNDNY